MEAVRCKQQHVAADPSPNSQATTLKFLFDWSRGARLDLTNKQPDLANISVLIAFRRHRCACGCTKAVDPYTTETCRD